MVQPEDIWVLWTFPSIFQWDAENEVLEIAGTEK